MDRTLLKHTLLVLFFLKIVSGYDAALTHTDLNHLVVGSIYEGSGDINECDTNPCGENAQCTNLPGSYNCECDPGFTGDGFNCTHINECDTNPCDVNANCTNLPGSYKCECNQGFTGDGFNCSVIELNPETLFGRSEGYHDNDWAVGYQGSFYEAKIAANTRSLTWKFDGQEESLKIGEIPKFNSSGFNVTFESMDGSYVSTMKLLRPLKNGDEGKEVEFFTVSDENETQEFNATISIKNCSSDGIVSPFIDVDYSSQGLYLCPKGEYLSFSNGSEVGINDYRTVCMADGKWKYEDEYVCSTDVNECESIPCGTNADCINTLGSFTCQCSPGYSGDPFVDCSEMLESNIEVIFNRSTDGNADDWAKGFTGSLYEAVITTSEPFTVGWTFKGENVEYTVQQTLTFAKQNRAGDTNFYVTFENVSVGVSRSVMNIITEFDLIDDKEKVEFYLIPAYPNGTRQDFNKTITIKECFDVRNHVTVSTNEDTGYGSEGDFICDNNGVLTAKGGAPYNDTSTVCRADGVWQDQESVECPNGDLSSAVGVDDVIGTGYVGDLFVAEIKNDVTTVVWTYNGNSQSYNVESNGSCVLQTGGSDDFQVRCELKGGNLTSTFTLKTPLVAMETSSVAFGTNMNPVIYQTDFQVKDCSVEDPLQVESSDGNYQTSGNFSCQSGSYLFLKNGSEPSDTKTTCLINAEWQNYDQFACYKPPANVTIVGNNSATEHDTLKFDCLYFTEDNDVTNIVFYLDDVIVQSGEETNYSKTAEISDNGKYVRCKAENLVNEGVDDREGFSLQLMLKIEKDSSTIVSEDSSTEGVDKNTKIIISCCCVGGAVVISLGVYFAFFHNKDKVGPGNDLESNSSVNSKVFSEGQDFIEMNNGNKKERNKSSSSDNSVET